jgi:transposase InsO family protein
VGTAFVHTVVDDCTRVAYAEICGDERADTTIGVLRRAVAWFAERGVTVERVLSDNGSAYRSHTWRDACIELGVTHKRTRPYRPKTNGKIERFHRTLADGWAYARRYDSETARRNALQPWLHFYNHHRAHSAIGGLPPDSRLNNLPGHHSSSAVLCVRASPVETPRSRAAARDSESRVTRSRAAIRLVNPRSVVIPVVPLRTGGLVR